MSGTSLIERLAVVPAVGEDYRPFAVSPDGTRLAVQWYRDGNWQIYLMDVGGGEPRRVGEFDDACWCPLFSPDGRFLYFARDDKGTECMDIYRMDLASGGFENLLPDTPDFSPLPDFDLSPDGTRIALSAQSGESFHAAVMPAAACPGTKGVRFLTDHHYNDLSPVWAPDGRRLAFAADTYGQDVAVFVADHEGALQATIGGSIAFLAMHPAWSPDGRLIAFAGGPFDHPAIGLYDVANEAISWAWRGDRDAHRPCWSPDGTALAFLTDRDAETGLHWLHLPTGEHRDLTIGAGIHSSPVFLPDGSALLCGLSAPGHPNDLFRIATSDGAVTRLTESLPDDLRGRRYPSGRHVRFTSRDHLAEVPGLLVEPDEPNGGAVVLVHGGPTWHHSNSWDPLRQAFLDAGLTVLHPNYRGSDGYGRRWQLANRWLMGQGEALDVAASWDFLVGLGCDPSRIAVTGRSWGGFMTMAMVTQFPELWACGVAGVPFFDFIDAAVDPAIREDLRWWDRENTGDPVKDKAKLEYYSPINHLDRVEAPLLLLAAENDPRCPPTQIAEVAGRLRARGKVCDYVIYPQEGHEISGAEHRLDYDRRTVEFILEHVDA
ncbi:MAG TPA: alpha/beta fold hydrolase [Thermoleophilia bacterium]|nr:alpha/beta fold hydrolase [Thermoleophilia bacterium]